MAYLIIYHNDQEVARHELTGPATLGRAPECDLRVHDILLSRRHCRIDPTGEDDGFAIADLGSKNGTRVGGNAVLRRTVLADGDVIRMGKTAVRFRTGPFVPSSAPLTPALRRPADPFEALAGTVHDFTYRPIPTGPTGLPFPSPRPSPREPAAYIDDNVRSMVSQLVSSSWDSIYEGASRPDPMVAHAHVAEERAVRRRRPREPFAALMLQVGPSDLPAETSKEMEAPTAVLESIDPEQGFEPVETVLALPEPARSQVVGSRGRSLLRKLVPIAQWLAILQLVWVAAS